jgi:fructose-1,6-bisphosphatase/inositol monophosphatase family enzyme
LTLSPSDLALSAAVEAVMRDAAARAIVPRYQTLAAHEIEEKAADDAVTVADTEASASVSATVTASSAKRPRTQIRRYSTG